MSEIHTINGVHYDFKPKNESFIKTALELKAMGVKNYYFMFRINNPYVADINPFNPRITDREIQLLMEELSSNIWFWCRSVVRLQTDAGVVPFGLHRGLAAAIYNAERHQDSCLCEPRQTWKTSGIIAGPIQWAFQLSSMLNIHFFGKETENTTRNLSTLKDDIDLLPEWLQFKRYVSLEDGREKKAKQSAQRLENNLMKNKVVIHPKPTSLSHAQGLARGGTGAVIYFDEVEHMPFFGEVLANSSPLYKTASENAARAGKPWFRLFSCTPGNLDTREGIDALPIIKSMIPWSEKIYDMSRDEEMEYKSTYMQEFRETSEFKDTRDVIDVYYMEYQYYQLRKNYQWVLDQYKASGDKMAIRREILMQRLRGSNQSPFAQEDIEYLVSHMQKSTNDIIINRKWRFLLYPHRETTKYDISQPFDPKIPYMVGIDPAAMGGDYFAFTIVNPLNLKIAAEFRHKYISGPKAVELIVTLIEDYMPNAVFIIERNSIGKYLIQMICEQTPYGKHLYWNKSNNVMEDAASENASDELEEVFYDKYKKYGNYLTGGENGTRTAMINLLIQIVGEHKEMINTEYLVDDVCKLVRTPTKRIEALKGEHDDSLFSWLHIMYTYNVGDNLESFGITKNFDFALAIGKDFQEAPHPSFEPGGMFSSREKTWDEEVMTDAIRQENDIKEMVDRFDFIHDAVYKKTADDPLKEQLVNINPSFFDHINDTFG